jgi:hypothetical protein
MSIKSIDDDTEKKTFLNMSIFFLNLFIIRSLNLRMSILKIFQNKWFLSFAHFTNRHKLVKMLIVFSIFWRKLIFLTFWMIFCFRSFVLYISINRLSSEWMINDVWIDECFWLSHHISWFRRMWHINWVSLRIQSFSSSIAQIFKSHTRIHRFRESMTSVTESTRFFQLFWSFSNRSIFTLVEKFEMNSTRFCKICESRSICDSMIDSNQISSCNVLICRSNKSS